MSAKRWMTTAAALMLAVQANVAAAHEVNSGKADELKARAVVLYSQPARWTEAARLLEKSVEYRAAYDAEIHTSLMTAASIWMSVGDYARAYGDALRAAENAHARGAVQDAAHSFISAAAVAAQLGRSREAGELMERARTLAWSPLLQDQERERILARDMSFKSGI